MRAISLSEYEFCRLRKKETEEKWIAIRVYSFPEDVVYVSKRFNEQFDAVLNVNFTDISESVEQDGKSYHPFSEENLQDILTFIQKHQDIDKVFVHCHAGICRSPGVVEGLARVFPHITAQHGLDGKTDVFPYPNVISRFDAYIKIHTKY